MFNSIFNFNSYLLLLIILVPIIGAFILLFIKDVNKIRLIALNSSLLTFVISLFLWLLFDNSSSKFQFVQYLDWSSELNISCTLGIDGISLFFILLTSLLFPLCILHSWVVKV